MSEIKGWGASWLLTDEGEVLYCSLETAANVGRVSDLIVARLAETGIKAECLRAICGVAIERVLKDCAERGTSVLFETGIDAEKWVISVIFESKDPFEVFKSSAPAAFLFSCVSPLCSSLIVRHQPDSSRLELDFLSLRGQESLSASEWMEVQVPSDAKDLSRKLKSTELGDLDYERLLRSLKPRKAAAVSEESVQTIKGEKKDVYDQSETRVSSDPTTEEEETFVSKFLRKWNVFSRSKEKSDAFAEKPASETESHEKTLERFQAVIVRAQEKCRNSKEEWANELIRELAQEKTRLLEMVEQLQRAARAQQYHVRANETGLQTELHRQEEQLRQKNAQISRLKDQLSTMSLEVERKRKTSNDSAHTLQLKMKNDQLQQQLASSKDEHTKLLRKLEDIRRADKIVTSEQRQEIDSLKAKLNEALRELQNSKSGSGRSAA